MSYELDRLGWLQFQELCTRLLQLDAGLPASAWEGAADESRFALVEPGLRVAPLALELPGPTLVQCTWLRPGTVGAVTSAVERLTWEAPETLRTVRTYLMLANGEVVQPEPRPGAVSDDLRVHALGTAEISARIDALPELRLAMPSLLGLRDLHPLIGPAIRRRSSLDIAAARDLAERFVPTRAHRRALAVLAEHRFAVLTGPPEMGKTATARMIALAQMTAGWEGHECTSPDDVWNAFDPARHQVFIADDAFGSTEYRADSAERWARAMERLLAMLDDRHWLIWTSRPAPLHTALGRLHRERGAERFPTPARVLVDAGELDPAEKALILFRHAKAAGLSRSLRSQLRAYGSEIVANEHFTPERIRRLILRLGGDDPTVLKAMNIELTTATEAMATSFSALRGEHRDLLVALLDAPPGPVPERELTAALRRHHDGALSHPPGELVDRLADHFLRVIR